MSRVNESQPLVPSVFDRLLDDDPANSRETAKTKNQVLRELKLSVQRDLQNLLNTRWRCDQWPPNLEDLDLSLVNYGIPDFNGLGLGSMRAREEFRRVVERIIQRFEPRFKRVSVELLDNADTMDRTIRFRIDALLFADPAPEPVVFDTVVEPVNGTFEFQGQRR